MEFQEETTQEEIADEFGLNKSDVSRITKKMLQNGDLAEMQQNFKPFLYNIWNQSKISQNRVSQILKSEGVSKIDTYADDVISQILKNEGVSKIDTFASDIIPLFISGKTREPNTFIRVSVSAHNNSVRFSKTL